MGLVVWCGVVCSKGYTREFCDWGVNRSKVVCCMYVCMYSILENLIVFKFGNFVSGHIKYW